MVALRKLYPGDLILEEAPLVFVPDNMDKENTARMLDDVIFLPPAFCPLPPASCLHPPASCLLPPTHYTPTTKHLARRLLDTGDLASGIQYTVTKKVHKYNTKKNLQSFFFQKKSFT